MVRTNKNRKVKISVLCMFLITAGYVATGFFPLLVDAYGTFMAGILASGGILAGAVVTEKALTKDVYLKELEKEDK